MSAITTIEGTLRADGLRFGLVAGRFNDFVVERLLSGAVDCLLRHGAVHKNLTLIRVPGAFELPLVAKKIAARPDIDGVVCLGAVIRGATPHFDFVAAEVSKGLAQVALDSMTPVGFGILTTDSLEQAIERAGSKAGNKGVEAALAVLEAIRVLEQL